MSDERESGVVRRVRPQDDRQTRSESDAERSRDGARDGASRNDPDVDSSPGAGGEDAVDSSAETGGRRRPLRPEDDPNRFDGDPQGDVDDDKKKKKKSGGGFKKRMQQIRRALAVAKAAHQGMMMAQMMLYLKAFLQAMMALVQAAAAAVSAAIAAVIQTVVAVVTTAAMVLGVSVAVATGGIAVLLILAIVVGVAVLGTTTASNVATRDDGAYDCNTDSSYMEPLIPVDAAEQTLANAKICYAFFKAYGLTDENIAGILGNWNHESGIDPTGTETIYNEPFTIPVPGTRKYEMWKGTYQDQYGGLSDPVDYTMVKATSGSSEYGLVTLKTSLWPNASAVLSAYHDMFPNIKRVGIGLGQWTNDRNQRLLDFADRLSLNWYDIETQLMFMVCPGYGDDAYHLNLFAGWGAMDDPATATAWFLKYWEGGGESGLAQRTAYAEQWYVTIQTWVEGVDYDLVHAQSLLDAVAAVGSAAGDKAGSSSLRSCAGLAYADNSSAAAAAVAFSWGPGEDCENDGTACWQHLADAMFQDVPCGVLYRSCDRTVAAALWWSGTDSEFPPNLGSGSPAGQLHYMTTSDNWQLLDWGGDFSKLLPGDVLIRCDDAVGHVVMYVGPAAVQARFGELYNGCISANYPFVSGSAGTKSPHVGGIYRDSAEGFQTYYAFRCVRQQNLKPERSSLTCVS